MVGSENRYIYGPCRNSGSQTVTFQIYVTIFGDATRNGRAGMEVAVPSLFVLLSIFLPTNPLPSSPSFDMSKLSLRNTNRSLNSVSSAQSSPTNSLRRAGGVASFVKTRGGVSGGETAIPANTNPGYNSPTPSEKRTMPPPPKMKGIFNTSQKNYEDMKVPIPETYEEEWDTGKSEDGAMKQPGRYQSDGFPERLAREWGNGNGNHGTSFPDETFPGLSDTESSLYRLNPKSPERNTQYNYDDYSSEADQQTQLDYEPSDVQ